MKRAKFALTAVATLIAGQQVPGCVVPVALLYKAEASNLTIPYSTVSTTATTICVVSVVPNP
jgi:hypothetical protein